MFGSSRAQIEPFHAMDILREANSLAAQGRRILHLETGQPSTKAPKLALEAAQAALNADLLGYTEALGRPALKAAIARRYAQLYDLDIPPERIIVTTGSSAGFVLSFLALMNAGDGLAMAAPFYPAYRNTAIALNLRPVIVRADDNDTFQLDTRRLDALDDVKALLIASPGNPTGTVSSPDELARIAQSAARKGWHVISDEIYHGLTYGGRAETMLRYAPDCIVINSFSKYYSMTGWRIGWMVVPAHSVRTFERLAQNLFISAPAISQAAAMAALNANAELEGHVARYRRNRGVLLAALQKSGVKRIAPADGAFYLYADVSHMGSPSDSLSRRLLHEAGIAIAPGHDFDTDQGQNWIRLSYAGATEDVEEAAGLLTEWFRRQ